MRRRPAANACSAITRCESTLFWPGLVASWRHGSPRRVPAGPRRVPRPQGQASLRPVLADREYTAFVGPFTVRFTGPLKLSDGTVPEPIGNASEIVFLTIARP